MGNDHEIHAVRTRGAFYAQRRGLISVSGGEAVQFLDGMITNNVTTLEDGREILAAFPNAQGRLLAVVRLRREGDRFLIETEGATREKVFQNLFRFSFAGDFFVEDVSERYGSFDLFGLGAPQVNGVVFDTGRSLTVFVPADETEKFTRDLQQHEAIAITDEVYEVLRIENGIPKYGVDMDETTIVPELGLDGMISYNKGCYIGQEIIARIHFRGHVAKQLTGLAITEDNASLAVGAELSTADGKSAGRLTSVCFSPTLEKTIALGFVRYEHLAAGTELEANGARVSVTGLPFVA